MKKFIKLLPLIAVVMVAGIIGTGCTAKVKRAYHERKADKYFAAGDWDRAEIEYLNVLHNDHENIQAASRLGGIYYDQGRLQRAAYFLNRVSTLSTNDLDARLKLGFIYSTLGQHKEARNTAEYVLARHPQDDQAPVLLAESAVGSNDMAAVRQKLLQLAKSGDRATVQVALGNLAFREHDFSNAATAFQRARAIDAKSAAVNSALASMAWLQKDLTQADAYFKAAAEALPVQLSYKMQYARFKMKTGRLEEAQGILNAISSNAPSYVPAMMARAEIAGGLKKYDECEALLAKVLARDEHNIEAMLFRGQVCQMRGDTRGALQSLGQMVRLYPQSPLAYYFLASANVAAGDTPTALANLSRAIELQPDFTEAMVLQARLLLLNGNAAPVIVTLEKISQKQPENMEAQLLLADAYRMKNRLEDAADIYRSLEAKFPNNAKLPMLLGAAYLQTQNAPAARVEFTRALQLEPNNLTAVNQLVDADIVQTNFDDATRRLEAELVRHPNEVDLHLMMAKVLIARGDVPKAKEKLEQTAALDPKNPFANLLLAQLHVNAKEHGKALEKLQEALASSTNNISAWMMSAAIHETDQEYALAAAAYEKVLTLDPKLSVALNNLACIYSEHLNQLDRAYLLAQEGRKLLPFEPSTADTLGWVYYRRGEFSSALALLKECMAKPAAAEVPEIQYHFGMASYMMAEETAAQTALTSALEKTNENEFPWRQDARLALTLLEIKPSAATAADQQALEKRLAEKANDPVALTRLAAIYARDGQVEKAIATHQKMLVLFPGHLPTIVSMARLYAAKDAPKALQLGKDAYKLAPYDLKVQHLLGQLAYAAKDFKLSASVLSEAVKQPAAAAQLFFDLARADFAVGKITESQAALDKCLTLDPTPELAAQSRQMLELAQQLMSPALPVGDTNKLTEILNKFPDDLPALAVQAEKFNQSGEAIAAIASYEKILAQFPDFAPAQKALGLLYLKDPAKRSRAYDLVIQARSFYADDVSLTKALGIIQFAKGDYQRATSLLKQSAIFLESDPEVYYYLGAVQYENKERAASKSSLQHALDLKLAAPLAESARKMLATMK